MDDQMHIQRPLQPIRGLGVGVCTATESAVATTGGGILPFQVVGMDILIVEVLHGAWMFWMRGLVLGAFRSSFVLLAAFVLDPDFDSLG